MVGGRGRSLGMSLLELIVVIGVTSTVLLWTVSLLQGFTKQQKRNDLSYRIDLFRRDLIATINNPAAWSRTRSHNASLDACLTSPGTGCVTGGVLLGPQSIGKVYDASDTNPPGYDFTSASNGINEQGQPCTTFTPGVGAGDSKCPIHFDVKWNPVCNPAACAAPLINITITPSFNTSIDESRGLASINLTALSSTFIQGNVFGIGQACWTLIGTDLYETCASSVGIGTTTPNTTFEIVSPATFSEATHTNGRMAGLISESEGNFGGGVASKVSGINAPGSLGPRFIGYASRGTLAAPQALRLNDSILAIVGVGHDGVNYSASTNGAAYIDMDAEADWTAASTPTRISFWTNPVGASSISQERMRISGNGNVGIGTTAPASALDLKPSAGTNGLYIRTTSAAPNTSPYGIEFSNNLAGAAHFGIELDYAGNFRIEKDSGHVFFEINPSGNVGVGIVNPQAPLEVSGDIRSTNGGGAAQKGSYMRWNPGIPPVGVGGVELGAYDWGSATYLSTQISAGNVYITNPSGGFTNLYFNGVCEFGCPSDKRLKDHVRPFTASLDAILGLEPVYYRYNGLAGTPKSEKDSVGLIAQDAEKSAPEIIESEKAKLHPDDRSLTEIKRVNYPDLIFIVINSVKDFFHKWTTDSHDLHEQIAALKQENLDLKKYLCTKDPAAKFCSQFRKPASEK